MSKIVSIFNQKGGVGKTTTAVNLAYGLSTMNLKVLLIDMDPQSNAGSCLLGEKKSNFNIYDVLTDRAGIREAIVKKSSSALDVIASDDNLAGLEMELAGRNDGMELLKKKIEEIKNNYDFIFIDSPPSLGMLSVMSLVASNGVLIPIQSEYYALEGVSRLFKTIELVRKNYNPHLEVEGVLITMYDGRNNLSSEVMNEVGKFFKNKLYDSVIHRNVKLAEAPGYANTIFEYDNKSRGAENYMNLCEEFIQKQ